MNINKTVTTEYGDSKKNYSYSAEDMSIIDCYVLVPLAKKLITKLPLWLPANIITIMSNGFVFLASVIALTARKTNWPIWILIPFLFIFYLIGDTADGLQARRTKTGSPLGEFCDHFLDTFVTGELLFCVLTAYGVRNLLFVGILLYVSYFTQMTAFWEKYVTSKLHLGKFGSSETVLVLSLFSTVGYLPKVHAFFTKSINIPISFLQGYNITLVEVVLAISLIFPIISIVTTLIRTKKISKNFILYLILGLILTLAATFLEKGSFAIAFLTLTFYHVDYSAALLSAIIMKEKEPKPDFILTAAMCIALFFDIHHPVLYSAFFLYIVVFVTARTAMFVHRNNKYWYWINPELPKEDENKADINKTAAKAATKTSENKTE
ncbi:MAG: CDP-alcohol phosphatidyltransferase family protein [Treponemataceae bacterium]|nr:CDP-alcohol phosphatidyltransferase family protein [Treponemataceae bacterium]